MSERTQRGLAETFYLKVTFFRCCSYPAESQIPRNHLYEPNSPFPKGPSAWCPSCYPSGLSPVSWPNSNEGSRQGVGHWLNGVYQHSALYCPSPTDSPRRAKTCHYHHFLQMRRQRRKFLPSIFCPGGSSHTGVIGTPSPPPQTVLQATVIDAE